MSDLLQQAQRLTIWIGESDRFDGKPLYEAIVLEARKRGLAGATAMRAIMGFGADSVVHTAKILRLSEDLPIVVEIVDHPDKIEAFIPVAESMMSGGMIAAQEVRVRAWKRSEEGNSPRMNTDERR